MKRKILLPTDFSKNSWNAISYAIDLYKNEKCEFYILNVFSVVGFASDNIMVPEIGELVYNKVKEASEKGLNKLLFRLSFKEENTNHEFFPISILNTLMTGIKEVVEKKDIDIIVMGTKGATNSRNLIFGSNTVKVMEKIRNCPVLAIPSEVRFNEPKEIVFPTSLKTHYKKKELQYLIEIARLNNASIRVLHIHKEDELDENQQSNHKLLEEYFDVIDSSFHYLKDSDVLKGLNSFVKTRGSDMIAFINKEHSFFERIFKKPLVKELGYHSKIPVLTLHDLRN